MRSRVRYVALATATLLGMLISAEPSVLAQDGGAAILATHALPDVAVAEAQAMAPPAIPIADDRGFPLGGTGSDLWRAPDDPDGEFWMATDRSPNGKIERVAVIDAITVAVANDNDFHVGDISADGRNAGEGKTSRILIVQTTPIPGAATAEPATPVPDASLVASAPVAPVEISGFAYKPRQIEVVAGTELVWTNLDGASHTVTAAGFDSG